MITSQLAGNALAKVAPGGGAIGAALQYRMLVQAGLPAGATVAALTAVNLLVFAVVLALPVLAIPALLRGAVDRTLLETAIAGLVDLRVAARHRRGAALHRPPAGAGSGGRSSACATALRRSAEPLHGLPDAAAARARPHPRDARARAGSARWRRRSGAGRSTTCTLLAALAAIGSHPRPGLVLLAFCGAQVLAQIPVTPGGLGLRRGRADRDARARGRVAGDAVLATFAYRLFSYWLPLPLGLGGFALHAPSASARSCRQA